MRNGAAAATAAPETNGHDDAVQANGDVSPVVAMDRTNQDIVRLIGQHLKTVGLKYVFLFLLFLVLILIVVLIVVFIVVAVFIGFVVVAAPRNY